jgi:transposase
MTNYHTSRASTFKLYSLAAAGGGRVVRSESTTPAESGRSPSAHMTLFMHLISLLSCALAASATAAADAPSAAAVAGTLHLLLGDEGGVNAFFEEHFGRKPFIVRDSSRSNRIEWMGTHRTFLRHEDVDLLLRANASAGHPDRPLALGRDVDMFRIAQGETGAWGRARIDSFYPSSSQGGVGGDDDDAVFNAAANDSEPGAVLTVDHARVHEAFADGFELVVYDMESRSAPVHAVVDRLAAFWMVPVSAALHFTPTRTGRIQGAAPALYAEDVFVVQLDGEASVHLYPDAISAPSRSEVSSTRVRAAVARSLASVAPETVSLSEGDVLYVPRGYALDSRTGEKISLQVRLAVETHACTVLDALLRVIDGAEALGADENPLTVPLFAGSASATFGDLLRVSARVAAHETPELRHFLHAGEHVSEAMEDADVDSAEAVLGRSVEKFVEAAQRALFTPMVDVLATEDEWVAAAADGAAEEEVIAWARRLHAAGSADELARMERMFQRCLSFLGGHRGRLTPAARRQLVAAYAEMQRHTRPGRMARIASSLRRHGQRQL